MIGLSKILSVLSSFLHVTQHKGDQAMARLVFFDCENQFVNRRWLWTGITRATQIEHVYCYRYSDNKDDKFNNSLVCSHFDNQTSWLQNSR